MQVRIRETGAVMFWNEFRDLLLAQNPGELITVAPQTEEWLDAKGADVVFEGPQATGGTVYQFSMRQGVEQAGGKWYTKYVLGPIFTDQPATDFQPAQTAAEQEAAYKARKDADQAVNVRQQRTEKLKDSDWTQLADSPVDKAAWAAYRQALRDITAQAGFPWTIDWPEQP
jgi:hypothetical protein